MIHRRLLLQPFLLLWFGWMLSSYAGAAELRTWTDSTGKYKTKAELVRVQDEKVTLRKTDGTTVTLPIDRLSEADQEYLEQQAADAQPKPARRGGSSSVANTIRAPALRTDSMNRLRQIGAALISYQATHGRFPPAVVQRGSNAGLSWRVALLPYLDEQALYSQFRLNEPWDSEHNKRLLEAMPTIYQSPGSGAPAGSTNYLAVRGNSVIDQGRGVRPQQIRDGLAKTVAVVEVNDDQAVPWTQPSDYEWDYDAPAEGLGQVWPGQYFLALFADGRVDRIPASIQKEVLIGLFTRDGGELLRPDQFSFGP